MAGALPSGSQVAPGKTGGKKKGKRRAKRSGGAGATSGIWARLTSAKMRAQVTQTAISAGTILGSGTLLSALQGYREGQSGKSISLMGEDGSWTATATDLRILLGAGGLLAGAAAKGRAGKLGWWSHRFTEVGVGSLASWLFEQGYDRGTTWGQKAAAAAAPTASGIVVGKIKATDVLMPGTSLIRRHDPEELAARETRLQKRLAKLRHKLHPGGGAKAAIPQGGVTISPQEYAQFKRMQQHRQQQQQPRQQARAQHGGGRPGRGR